ncbi:MAG: ABC transporter substrate-binding protein [Desulfovermiculus sp.]
MKKALLFVFAVIVLGVSGPAWAEKGQEVRLVQVNWTGVTAKTETAAYLLEKIGYKTDVVTASVPIMFQSLSQEERDVALGLWLPTQREMIRKHMLKGDIDLVTTNLTGAKYTVAVTKEAYEEGVQHFSDLDKYKDKFDSTIYGIEAGNDGNEVILDMIEDDAYGLGDWELMPSSEAGMLTQVKREINRDNPWIAWLGWAPHPMNLNIDMKFLHGGEEYWGPNQGAATVHTICRTGYAWKNPNIGQFFENYTFTVDEQAQMGDYVINQDMDYVEAGIKLIKEKPELLERWFDQGGTYKTDVVKTADGKQDALEAIKEAMDL